MADTMKRKGRIVMFDFWLVRDGHHRYVERLQFCGRFPRVSRLVECVIQCTRLARFIKYSLTGYLSELCLIIFMEDLQLTKQASNDNNKERETLSFVGTFHQQRL
jgi:hypothetical protein